MIPDYDSRNGISGKKLITANAAKGKTASLRVLSTKVFAEDYGAYKIAARSSF